MKHHHVEDISNYRRYAPLRALSAYGTNRIGMLLAVSISIALGTNG